MPIKKGKVAVKAGRADQPLSSREREDLVNRIEAETAYKNSLGKDLPDDGTLGSLDAAGSKLVDKEKLGAKIKRMENTLERGTVAQAKGPERNKLVQEAADLKVWIRDHALTRKELDLMPRHGYEYHAAVRKSQKSEVGNPDFAKKCGRYREIMARIDPENPEATSIDILRKP